MARPRTRTDLQLSGSSHQVLQIFTALFYSSDRALAQTQRVQRILIAVDSVSFAILIEIEFYATPPVL